MSKMPEGILYPYSFKLQVRWRRETSRVTY